MPNDTRIMAVDDREENLTALAAVLGTLPMDFVPVTSGRAALKELENDDFALILLDVVMPEMDGFETAEHIRSLPRARDIPIIFLTACGAAGKEAYRGYAAGAADFLTKPFDPWLLRAKVSVFVDLHRRTVQLGQQARLLRRTLGGDDAENARAGCERLLAALDERLAKVEDAVARLRSGEPADDLDGHVGELRRTLDAFSAGD
ncbi:two-component system response regulator [Actinomadura chokoriensis]|uniref:Response regulator n=1 Tax=Actinomadura chokoriensis TaxID=454156 RepID=A0ABV4R116_9ACTN